VYDWADTETPDAVLYPPAPPPPPVPLPPPPPPAIIKYSIVFDPAELPALVTVNVPDELNVWILKSPLVVSVPPVAATYCTNVRLLDAADGADVPIALVAVTVNV
jgi:hypothetical protein